MITLWQFMRLAVRNLLRGGQRILVALLCILFGIMTLVAMMMLAQSIASAVIITPAETVGGDLSIVRKTENTLRAEDVDQLKALQQSGAISAYTLIAFNNDSLMFHTSSYEEMHFAGTGMGIESDKYPLIGSLSIGEPGSLPLPSLLQEVGDVVITRDIAEQYQLEPGDSITLSDLHTGVPLQGVVRGIAYDTPNHRGEKIYYSIATAQRLASGQPVMNTAIITTAQAEAVAATLDSSGWTVDWTAGRKEDLAANVWVIGLRGAGILGLLVGGIGIANTMQVLLRRRQREIAIWKTLGYREGDLRLIFSLEAGLLGLTGSVLGAGLGVLISTGLLELFRRTSSLLYQWTFSPVPPLMGILVGTVSTLVFAFWAIVRSSQTRPMTLLRNEPLGLALRGAGNGFSGCQSILLGLLLISAFTALTSLVMEFVVARIGVLIGIGVGIGSLALFFSGLLWVCTHSLPLRRFPLLRMAFTSLQRRGFALVFAMIALFVGVLSLSMGLTVTQFSERRISGGSLPSQGYNLNILTTADQESAVRQAVEAQHPEKMSIEYRTALASLSLTGEKAPLPATDAVLIGSAEPDGYLLSGADWGSQPDGVYAFKWANLKAGSQVTATFQNGETKIFTVVGSYTLDNLSMSLYPPTGLLMTTAALTKVAQPDALTYFVQVAPGQVSQAAQALGAELPQATVVNLVMYAARFMQSYQNLYILAIAMAGMALLAGILLVSNSISLAMLDRRYEMGILKAVGYSRRQILSIFAVEYGLVSLLATGAGVLVIQGLLAGLAIAAHLPVIITLLGLPALALIAGCGIGLTLLTVLGVTWGPTRVSPVVVLNGGSG